MLVAGTLAACSEWVEKLAPKESDRFARQYLAALASGDSATVHRMTKPHTRQLPGFEDLVLTAHELLRHGSVEAAKLQGFEVNWDADSATVTRLTYHVGQDAGGVEVELWLEEPAGARYVETVRVAQLSPE